MKLHDLKQVSGGPECNHTMWECRCCKRKWTDIHEWDVYGCGYMRIRSDMARESVCDGLTYERQT